MKDIRSRLLRMLHDLAKQDQALQKHLRNEEGRIPEQREDWMNIIEQDEVVEALEKRTLDRMRAILAAIDRVDDGTYGYSVKSGRPIEPERLAAIPWATLTADEAREAEIDLGAAVDAGASLDKARPLESGPPPGLSPGPTGSRDED